MSIAHDRALPSPLVTILDLDIDRLDALAAAGEKAGHPIAEFLTTELERAVVRPVDQIGSNVVRMHSRIAFQIEGRGDVEVRTLVYPDEYARRADRGDCISVMTPVGAALLGLQAGTGMSYKTVNGANQFVHVVAVLQQPGPVGDGIAAVQGDDDLSMPASRNRRPPSGHDLDPTNT